MVLSLFSIEKFDFKKWFLQLASITAIFCFKKYDNFLHIFWKNQNFGLLARSICVTPELFDIGGSKGIIWSLPSSNGLVIGSLLASGGRKNHFFGSTIDWWNNHLHTFFSLFSCLRMSIENPIIHQKTKMTFSILPWDFKNHG